MNSNSKYNPEHLVEITKYLKYLKKPVDNKSELWTNHPDGGEHGWFAIEALSGRVVVWSKNEKDWVYADSVLEVKILELLDTKADADKVYLKEEIDEMIQKLSDEKADADSVYTIEQSDKLLKDQKEDLEGQIVEGDTLLHNKIKNLQNMNIRKVYSSYEAMLLDVNNPIGRDGLPILDGQFVSVANPSDVSKDGVYNYSVVGDVKSWIYSGGVGMAGEVAMKTDKSNFFNLSQEYNNYAYADKATARHAVPADTRAKGQVIAYQLANGKWVMESFEGAKLSVWTEDEYWKNIGVQLTQKRGDSEELAISQKLFESVITQRADGGYIKEGFLYLTSEGIDIGIPIELGKGGIINVTEDNNGEFFADATVARGKVDKEDRIPGQLISYRLTTDGWILDMFIGESPESWLNEGVWVQFATTLIVDSIAVELETIKGLISSLEQDIANKGDGLFVDEDDILYLTNNGEIIGDGVQLPEGGGGSGSGIVMRVRAVGGTSIVAGEGSPAIIRWNFTSVEEDGTPTGEGTIAINVNNIPVYSGNIDQGDGEYDVRRSINMGSNRVVVRIVDGYNNARSLTYNVQKATLLLTSTFADDVIYTTEPVNFRYTVVGSGEKTINFKVNGVEIAPDITSSSGQQLTKALSGLKNGSNAIEVTANSSVEGSPLKSNTLYFEFIYADSDIDKPVITTSFKDKEVRQFSIVKIPYFVYDPYSTTALVSLRVNGTIVSTLNVPRVRQTWDYIVNDSVPLEMIIECGVTRRVINLTVLPSENEIEEVKADLEFKALAIGKSNQSLDRDKWSYNGYNTKFNNFLWKGDGWQKDSGGNSHLKLISDANIEVGITPFNNQVLSTGMSITIEFSTENVTDEDVEIISCMHDNIGISVTPTAITLKSAQSTITSRLDSSVKVSVSFVVDKRVENKILYLYIDGVISGAVIYPDSDSFTQALLSGMKFNTGNRKAIVNVYGIRWYKNNLNYNQILGNYVYDTENIDTKEEIRSRNDLVDEYGKISMDKALDTLPVMILIGKLPLTKTDWQNTTIIYTDRQNPKLSFTAYNVMNAVQGTSSVAYPRKNYIYKLEDGIIDSEGRRQDMYSLRGTGVPAFEFCMKADFAESSGVHNTGLAVVLDKALKDYGMYTPPQLVDPRVRTTIDGFPVLIMHQLDDTSEMEFIGKYNFNNDKSSPGVFGFEPGVECWEFRNNTADRSLFKSADFSGTDWLNDFESRYPKNNTDASNFKKVFEWVVSCKDNPSKFKAECDRYFDVKNLLFYWLKTEHYGMVDQRAKNQFMLSYDGVKWIFIFYDNDTALGIDNIGIIKFKYDIETTDIVGSGHVWNGWDSELWKLVMVAYADEIGAMYRELRQKGILSYEAAINIFEVNQSDKWAEKIYNEDGWFKYIQSTLEGSAYLGDLQGSRASHRKWWLGNRFEYMDSKYEAGKYVENYGHLRLYSPAGSLVVAPNMDITVTRTKPGYTNILYGSYRGVPKRVGKDEAYKVVAPAQTYNDTETHIYGIETVKSLGDLSNKYLGLVDLSKAYALEELIIGNTKSGYRNDNCDTLVLGNNERLRKINVANLKALKSTLNLKQCYSIEEIEARGSSITGCDLPDSGVIKTIRYPASVANITLRNQHNLTTLSVEGYAMINTLIIDNVPSIDGYALAKTILATVGNRLNKARLTDIDISDSDSGTLMRLSYMGGEDDNGNATDVAVITGKAFIATVTNTAFDRLTTVFPDLEISVGALLDVVDIHDLTVKQICLDRWDANLDGEISEAEIADVSFPKDILIGTGAKTFNELHYFKGNNSILNGVDTITEASMIPGKTKFLDLLNLRKVQVYPENEPLNAEPKLTMQSFGNCYNIQDLTLRGRYIGAEGNIGVLGKMRSDYDYNKFIFPVRGNANLFIRETVDVDIDNIDNLNWWNDVQTITLEKARTIVADKAPLLRDLNITGLSKETLFNKIEIKGSTKIKTVTVDAKPLDGELMYFKIDHDYQGTSINSVVITNNVRCNSLAGSAFYINYRSNVKHIDLGENYKPLFIGGYKQGSTGYTGSLVIRSKTLINTNINWGARDIQLYVPDDLVVEYAADSRWGLLTDIFPLSQFE